MIPITLAEVLLHLYPTFKWGIDAMGKLFWDSSNPSPPPTEQEIETTKQYLIQQYPYKLLRQERNKRLADCDYIVIRAYSQQQPVPTEWADYMQQLRDLPSTSNPKLTELGQLDMSSINFPTPPS